MAASAFDPYYAWLGIHPDEQPASYYRLLGVRHLESDLSVIRNASDRQMTFVKEQALGEHAKLSQRLLNELAAARRTLLNVESKAAYDRTLSQQGELSGRADRAPVSTVPQGAGAINAEPSEPTVGLAAEQEVAAVGVPWRRFPRLIVVASGVVIVLIGLGLNLLFSPDGAPSQEVSEGAHTTQDGQHVEATAADLVAENSGTPVAEEPEDLFAWGSLWRGRATGVGPGTPPPVGVRGIVTARDANSFTLRANMPDFSWTLLVEQDQQPDRRRRPGMQDGVASETYHLSRAEIVRNTKNTFKGPVEFDDSSVEVTGRRVRIFLSRKMPNGVRQVEFDLERL